MKPIFLSYVGTAHILCDMAFIMLILRGNKRDLQFIILTEKSFSAVTVRDHFYYFLVGNGIRNVPIEIKFSGKYY